MRLECRSFVTFHHIVDPQLRKAAVLFIHDCLADDGFFLFSDWDNPGTPVDFTIYMDLTHFLPDLFDRYPASTKVSLRPLKTEYLSIQGWAIVMASHGLVYSNYASLLPWTVGNKLKLLGPYQTVNLTCIRNFMATFTKLTDKGLHPVR